jgi:hypothetical protein
MQSINYIYLEDWRNKLVEAIANGNEPIVRICIDTINLLFHDIRDEANFILANTVHNPITEFTNHRNLLYLNMTEKKLQEKYPQTFSNNAISQLFYAPNRNLCKNFNTNSGKQISRDDLLKVTGYSIKIAQICAPSNPLYEQAADTLVVCKAINDSLSGWKFTNPTVKMSHYANDFITKEVLKQARTDDEKRLTHGMSLLVDLAIDLFVSPNT